MYLKMQKQRNRTGNLKALNKKTRQRTDQNVLFRFCFVFCLLSVCILCALVLHCLSGQLLSLHFVVTGCVCVFCAFFAACCALLIIVN